MIDPFLHKKELDTTGTLRPLDVSENLTESTKVHSKLDAVMLISHR